MDNVLCDELLQEIFHRLPPPSSSAVSLVSKRWCTCLRNSTTCLSLNLQHNTNTSNSFSTFLSNYPFLSSLSIASDDHFSGDQILFIVSATCLNLKQLRFLSSPVSPFSLSTLSTSCTKLVSVSVTVSRPLCFTWLTGFKSLKSLTLYFETQNRNFGTKKVKDCNFDVELGLESLSLNGIMDSDYEIGCVWKNCKNVKKLVLKSCESLGDYYNYPFFTGFLELLSGIHELELRSCRNVVDGVLLKLAENSVSLRSLLIYDGGNKEGLLHFIKYCKCELTRLDLRLPLDLDNSHLIALSENLNFRGLTSLSLQSCCLVSGEGLRAIARTAMGDKLEELALINCDVVERESGLLTSLGQGLKRLRKLDLSYNDMLVDKELVSMLVSCHYSLEDLKLRGCNKLSNLALGSMVRSCKMLRSVDIKYCRGIDIDGVELLVNNSARLKHLEVEQGKISGVSRERALIKCIEVVS